MSGLILKSEYHQPLAATVDMGSPKMTGPLARISGSPADSVKPSYI